MLLLSHNNIFLSQFVEKYQIHVNEIYIWQKRLFEGARFRKIELFGSLDKKPLDSKTSNNLVLIANK
jgi:hypothetical protein